MRTRLSNYSGLFDPEPESQPADMAGILQDVLDHPDDDRYRLIFADYSEDAGQPDVARFVRGDKAFRFAARHFWQWYYTPTLQKVFGPGGSLAIGPPLAGVPLRWHVTITKEAGAVWELLFRKGFVERITLPCDDWMKHGRNLVKEFPLLRVELSDKKPSEYVATGTAGWSTDKPAIGDVSIDGTAALPHALFLLLGGHSHGVGSSIKLYDSPAAAANALSIACLKLVRG